LFPQRLRYGTLLSGRTLKYQQFDILLLRASERGTDFILFGFGLSF
jgi:hypothetical protein